MQDFSTLRGRRVFLTGHTGFKGSWASLLLKVLGCEVVGYALPPNTQPSLFELASLRDTVAGHTLADIRDDEALANAMRVARPDLVLHMAAQALVRQSYLSPRSTWETNTMGTVNVLEAVRKTPMVAAVVIVTTDKCYENRGWEWGYRETDALGGHDPYSASKAGAELVAHSYRQSFFGVSGPLVATARAGNVIGGGDWSDDRLIADAARAAASGQTLAIRNPGATRPWQHVLDCLSGYVSLAAALLQGDRASATAYNFGPAAADNLTVGDLLTRLGSHWPELRWHAEERTNAPREAMTLYLDSSRARSRLGWAPRWPLGVALEKTAEWYRAVIGNPSQARALADRQIEDYLSS